MYELTTMQSEMTETEGLIAVGAAMFAGLIMLGIVLLISIVICAILYGCFQRVPPEHRKMEAGLVWLLLIPLFNLVWNFFVFRRLPESYQGYFASRGEANVGDCGASIGLWYSICAVVAIVPCVNYIAFPASLILLIIFLVKALELKKRIPEGAPA